MDVYTDVWQSRSNTLSSGVTDVATPVYAVRAASDVSPIHAPEAEAGIGYQNFLRRLFISMLKLMLLQLVLSSIPSIDASAFLDEY